MAKVFLKKEQDFKSNDGSTPCSRCYFEERIGCPKYLRNYMDELICVRDHCHFIRIHPTPEEAARLEAKYEDQA